MISSWDVGAIGCPTKRLSPFRYPGGKSWLVPTIGLWLQSKETKPQGFVEPFAGGAIVGLNVAYWQLADAVILVELDSDVAAVWNTIINGDAKGLADRILGFELNSDTLEAQLNEAPCTALDRAFRTILRNRTNRSGILAPGAGLLNHGENGRGIKSRWYPDTLWRRVLDVAELRPRITFIEGDGLHFLGQCEKRDNVVFFIDPPYVVGHKQAGKRLYRHSTVDHEALFDLMSRLEGDFVATYSNDDTILGLCHHYRFDTCEIMMKNSHHKRMTELIIGRDLAWLKRLPLFEV